MIPADPHSTAIRAELATLIDSIPELTADGIELYAAAISRALLARAITAPEARALMYGAQVVLQAHHLAWTRARDQGPHRPPPSRTLEAGTTPPPCRAGCTGPTRVDIRQERQPPHRPRNSRDQRQSPP